MPSYLFHLSFFSSPILTSLILSSRILKSQACQEQMQSKSNDDAAERELACACLNNSTHDANDDVITSSDIVFESDDSIIMEKKIKLEVKKKMVIESRKMSLRLAALSLQDDLESTVKDDIVPTPKVAHSEVLISFISSMTNTIPPIAPPIAPSPVMVPSSALSVTSRSSFSGNTEGDVKLVNVSIAYSEVLQLQVKLIHICITHTWRSSEFSGLFTTAYITCFVLFQFF